MNLIFTKLHIENFMSIGNMTLDLEDCGYTLIEGVNNNPLDGAHSNGSGKSSIFESLVWCLTGNTIRGNKNVVSNNSTGGTLVSVNFTIDGDNFEVIRTKDHTKYKTNLFITINGKNKSGKGIRDTEKLFSEYLPDLTASLIGSVVVLGQGLPQKFSNNSASGRKEILEKLCKSDFMIQDLKIRISARAAELADILRSQEDSKLQAATRLSVLTESTAKEKNVLEALSQAVDFKSLLDELNIELEQKQYEVSNVETNIATEEEALTLSEEHLSSLWHSRDEELSKAKTPLSEELEHLYKELKVASTKRAVLESQLRTLSSMTGICPTCNQPLPDFHKPDTTAITEEFNSITAECESLSLSIFEKEKMQQTILEEVKSRFSQDTDAISESILQHKVALNGLRRHRDSLIAALNSVKNSIVDITNRMANHTQNVERCKTNISEYEKEMGFLVEDIKKYTTDIEETNTRISIINKFLTIISRDFRGYLLNDIIVYINKRAKDYCKDIFGTDLIEFHLEGNNLLISYNDKEYESLSGGERQKVDLIVQFAIRDMLCSHTSFSSNIIVLDEIFDNLDDLGSKRVIDAISNKLCDIHSIFIISHHGNELNIPCDNVIKVEKDENGITRLCN